MRPHCNVDPYVHITITHCMSSSSRVIEPSIAYLIEFPIHIVGHRCLPRERKIYKERREAVFANMSTTKKGRPPIRWWVLLHLKSFVWRKFVHLKSLFTIHRACEAISI